MAFRERTAKLYVHLHPSCLDNPGAALNHELDSKLLQYDEVLKGVVLAYDQVKVEEPGSRVRIFNDSHFLNVHISVRLLLFSPKKGIRLVGEVNYTSGSGVGLLVHGIFNASIQDANIPQDWEYYDDDDDGYWEKTDGEKMEIGTLVSFEVLELNQTDNILSIQASILDDKYGVVGKVDTPLAERHRIDSSAGDVVDINKSAVKDVNTLKKRKPDAEMIGNGEAGATPKSNKKSKKKSAKEELVSSEQGEKDSEQQADATKTPKQKKDKKEKKDKSAKKEKSDKKERKK